MRLLLSFAISLAGVSSCAVAAQGTATAPIPRVIRALRYPAISPDGSRIAFCYRGDLWTVPGTGGEAKRIAELPGWDSRPRWSPDGRTLAFSSDAKGNTDLYTLPVEGGTPKQLTFHSAEDYMGDWSADGKSLTFYSARDSRLPVLYTLGVEDGRLREVARDEVALASPTFSPDGATIVYCRGAGGWARKGYRGSANADLYTVSLRAGSVPKRLTATPNTEAWPLYSPDGKWLYFVADRDGAGALWKQPASGGKATRVTQVAGQYLHYPALSHDGKTLVFETDFSLWTVDLTSRKPEPRRLTVTAVVRDEPREETNTLTNGATELEVSPDGSQLALGLRGDIYLVSSGGGDAKRITDSQALDYDFSFSPDGKRVTYVSERDANVDVFMYETETGQTRRLTTDPDPDTAPVFSPDGRQVLFVRGVNGRELVTVPSAGGAEKVVAEGAFFGMPRWSPDSRWVAYTRRDAAALTNVYARPVEGGDEINISRWNGFNTEPTWSPDGRRLAFLSSRSGSMEIYTVDLDRHKSPGAAASINAALPAGVSLPVTIDASGIERRVRQLVSDPAGSKGAMAFAPDGLRVIFSAAGGLYAVPTAGGTATRLAEGVGGAIRLTRDGSAMFTLSGRSGLVQRVEGTGGTPTPVPFRATVTLDLNEQQRQAFDQAWRMMRDSFYDPKMHGVDWNGVRSRYRAVVDECATIQDFHLLLTEMIGELNASHTGASRGADVKIPRETGQLGLWFDWSHEGPGLLVKEVLEDGPADQDESRIRPGEYVVAVAGKDAAPMESIFEALAGQSGRSLELLVNGRPDRNGARLVRLFPASRARFTDLLYEQWVERNRARVEQLSGGRLAYAHIREMKPAALQRFERELLTYAYGKEGLVLDVRFNPGGRIHDELFALLTRKVHVFETPRDALKMTQPFGAFTRPSILLINQGSFSDAEIFANGFRANGLGKIVGVPTGGGVIGTTNVTLLDGETEFRLPRTGWNALDGTNLENYGVPPDYYVEYLPSDLAAGKDPQIEKAVMEMLKGLRSVKH